VASLNVVCTWRRPIFHTQLFDGPFFLRNLSKDFSLCRACCRSLVGRTRVFLAIQVRTMMAVTDPLTGLANIGVSSAVLDSEVDPFPAARSVPSTVVLRDHVTAQNIQRSIRAL